MRALKREEFSLKKYYINKIKKIYLPLIMVVFITIIIFKINQTTNWINLKQETNSVIWGYNNFWQLNANLDYFTKNVNSPFIHFWYISILMQFELLFPILFLMLKKINKKIKKDIATILVGIVTITATIVFFIMSKNQEQMQVYYNTFARSFSLLFGVFLGLLHHKYDFKIAKVFKRFDKCIYCIYSIVLIGLCVLVSDKSPNYAFYMILTTIISLRIIEYSTLKSTRKNKFIEFLAKESYGIYLAQYPMIYFLQGMQLVGFIKIPLIIILTYLMSRTVKILTNKLKSKTIKIIFLTIVVSGSILLVTQEDYSYEMKELENKLNENQKIIEEQNGKFLNSVNIEKQDDEVQDKEVIAENIEEKKKIVSEEVKNLPIVGVGDSVLLGVSDELRKQFPNGYFDGKVSRTIVGGKEVLQNLKNQGKLSNVLVLALANNGDYIEKRNRDFMEFIGDREVYWINAVGADDPEFNQKFKEFAKNYPNIHIVDWNATAQGHPEYFYADGIHIKGEGVKAYVNMLYEAIYNVYWENYEKEKINIE